VTDIQKLYPIFEAMQAHQVPLLIHGEVTDPNVDVFDREARFIETQLIPLQKQFPALKTVLEHITTKEAVEYVRSAPAILGATITAHHLLYDRNHLLVGGIHPHYYCLPVLKRRTHREALLQAATSGNPKFFLGTDSAPHPVSDKESDCGCAGIYSAYSAIELYAEAFEQVQALDKLEAFASHFGADFYELPRNPSTITLEKINWKVPEMLEFGHQQLKPLRAGETLSWKII
jgi:dihydroorotase